MSTDIEKKPEAPIVKKDLKYWLGQADFTKQVESALPSHIKPTLFIRTVLTALVKNPKILDCSKESVFKCLFDCAASGLVVGSQAHLVPYGNTCTLIIDYKGLIELSLRSGTIESVHADVVCENEVFTVNAGKLIDHAVDYRKPRGKVYAVYCLIRMAGGGEKLEVMTFSEIEAIRNRSKCGGAGPWKSDFNEMAKKTVTRRAMKWVSLSPEIREAVDRDQDDLTVAMITREQPSFKQLAEPVLEPEILEEKPE